MGEERELNEFQKEFRDKALEDERRMRAEEGIDEEEEDVDLRHGRYMTFKCDNDFYGISIANVEEIIGVQSITEVPETPDYVKGLINLRGKIIPVVDVRIRFGKEARDYDDRTCVIVINVNEDVIGLAVDTIADVVTIQDEDILDPPSAGSSRPGKFISGIGKVGDNVKFLVDPEMLIYDND